MPSIFLLFPPEVFNVSSLYSHSIVPGGFEVMS